YLTCSVMRCNAIAPVASTRHLGTVVAGEELANDPNMSPENPAAVAVWLASPLAAGINGQVLKIMGGYAQILRGWSPANEIDTDEIWTIEALDKGRAALFAGIASSVPPFNVGRMNAG